MLWRTFLADDFSCRPLFVIDGCFDTQPTDTYFVLLIRRDPTDPILDTGFLNVPHAQGKSRG